jgi:hypothetical protein
VALADKAIAIELENVEPYVKDDVGGKEGERKRKDKA